MTALRRCHVRPPGGRGWLHRQRFPHVSQLQMWSVTNPTHSCDQGGYLGSYKALCIRSVNPVYVASIFIKFKEGRTFLMGYHVALTTCPKLQTIYFLTSHMEREYMNTAEEWSALDTFARLAFGLHGLPMLELLACSDFTKGYAYY